MKTRAALALSLAVTVLASMMLTSAGADEAANGAWVAPFSEGNDKYAASPPDTIEESQEFPTAVSAVVLPNGNVVYWNGLQDIESGTAPLAADIPEEQESETRLLDLSGYWSTGSTSAIQYKKPSPEIAVGGDLFCADQRLLADGRVLVAGGTWWNNEDAATTNGTPAEGFGRSELYGRADTRAYDYTTGEGGTWTPLPNMEKGRWYPTLVTLTDGTVLVAGGVERLIHNSSYSPGAAPPDHALPENVTETEVFDPSANDGIGTWSTNQNPESHQSLPLYPRLRLMPNGKVFFDATGQMWGPFGEDVNQLGWNQMKWFDPATDSWSDAGMAPLGARNGSSSTMLPLKPDDNWSKAQILVAGGTLGTSPGGLLGTTISEMITIQGDTIDREMTAGQMNSSRWFSTHVGLPTGEVLAFNGADTDEVIWPGSERAVKTVEQFDPATGTWKVVSSSARERTYHNNAVLLKDGTVLVGGHSPINNGYGPGPSTAPGFANNFKDPSFEIYKPPYLFRGDRPDLQSAPATGHRGNDITIGAAPEDVANGTLKVALTRLPNITHIQDADQRTVWLNPTAISPNAVKVDLPESGSVLPDGFYYLFLMKDNGEGLTPSVAEIIKIVN